MSTENVFRKINSSLLGHAELVKYPYVMFGVFCIIAYPLYYLLWHYVSPQGYESIFIRSIAVIIAIPLALKSFWPECLKRYLVLYWYVATLYCLPFFFTYMTLANHFSPGWVLNSLTGVVLSILLLDLVPLLVVLPLGILLGLWVYGLTISSYLPAAAIDFSNIAITYAAVIIFGALFARHKQSLQNKEVLLAKKKSEEVSEAKTEFIANMSHDLRTPMAGVLGMFDGMLFAVEDARSALAGSKENSEKLAFLLEDLTKRVDEYAQMGKESAGNLTLLFNDILENIELESGETNETAEPFNLDQVVQSSVSLLKPVAENKRLLLTAEIEQETPCHLIGFHQSLRRILLNLIGNALKFTQAGTISVVVSLADEQKTKTVQVGDVLSLKIQVNDTGIGIPGDKFEEIFNHFSRLSSSYQGTHKGLGLGLYAVKNYVEAMQGTIEVESKEGIGSCFTVLLPFEVDKLGVSQSVVMHREETPASLPKDKCGEGLCLLLVEDDPIAAMAIQIGLSHMGCQVEWAKSGEEAIQKASSRDYALIFMDIGLPSMSGIDVTREIRGLMDSKKSSVPIVALTGHAGGKSRQLCLDAGMQSVLSKPVDQAELKKALAYFARKKSGQ